MFFRSGKLKKRTQIIFARNNTHKGFSNCSSSSLKKYTAIHKTLITAAFSRRFKFVSVRRRFVICDFWRKDRFIGRLRARNLYQAPCLRSRKVCFEQDFIVICTEFQVQILLLFMRECFKKLEHFSASYV